VTWAIPAVPGMRVLCPPWGQFDGIFRLERLLGGFDVQAAGFARPSW